MSHINRLFLNFYLYKPLRLSLLCWWSFNVPLIDKNWTINWPAGRPKKKYTHNSRNEKGRRHSRWLQSLQVKGRFMAIFKNDEVVINFDACENKLDSLEDFIRGVREKGFVDEASISIKQNLATGEVSLNAYTNHSADLTL